MKKSHIITLLAVVFAFILSACTAAPGAAPPAAAGSGGIGAIFANLWTWIVYIGALKWAAGSTDALIAVMRLGLGIALYSILYFGAGVVFQQRNIRITLALVISAITVIFLPSAILVAVGVGMGSLFGLLLLSLLFVPLGLALWKIPKDTRGHRLIRAAIAAAVCWVLIIAKEHATTTLGISGLIPGPSALPTGSVAGDIESMATSVLAFVNWGITIAALIAVWELVMALFFTGAAAANSVYNSGWATKVRGTAAGAAKGAWNGAKASMPGSPERKKAALAGLKSTVNQAIREKAEIKLVDDARELIATLLNDLRKVKRQGELKGNGEHSALKTLFKKIGDAFQEASKHLNRDKRKQRSQAKKIAEVIKAHQERGHDVEALEIAEKEIWKLEEQAGREFEDAYDEFNNKIIKSGEYHEFESVGRFPHALNGDDFNMADLDILVQLLGEDYLKLQQAEEHLVQANEQFKSVLAALKKLK